MGKCPPGLIQAVFFQLRLREIIPSSRMIRHMLDGRVSPGDPIDVLSRNATKAPSEAASFIPNGPEWMAVEVSQQCVTSLVPFSLLYRPTLGLRATSSRLSGGKLALQAPGTARGSSTAYRHNYHSTLSTLQVHHLIWFDVASAQHLLNPTIPPHPLRRKRVCRLPIPCRMLIYPCFPNFNAAACARLIERAFALHELPSLIDEIFSRKDVGDTIRRLPGDGAQSFVDVIDEVRSTFSYYRASVG